MSQRLATAALMLGLLTVLPACGGASDVDRNAYLARNVELLASFPTPAGSHAISSAESEPWKLEAGAFGGLYIAGYKTSWSFATEPGTTALDLGNFYRCDLEGWRRANWGRSFATSERSVCYRGSLASICVRWLTNLDRTEPSGLPFQVSIDSRAYAHRDTAPW